MINMHSGKISCMLRNSISNSAIELFSTFVSSSFRKECASIKFKHPSNLITRELCTQWTTARTLTTLSQAAAGTAVSKDEKREFMAVFPDIVRDLTDAGRHLDIPDATKWYAKALQYNVPGGKKNRGMALVLGYKFLANSKDLSPENMRLARILGWCVELLQGFYLVTDDIIDQATTRRGRPCWYRNPGVGLTAINDALLIESGIYQLLRRHFRTKPYYVDIIELFHDVELKTNFGQALDMLSEQTKDLKLENFTMDRYNSIVKYKTAYYTFQLPIALAMHMAGISDEEKHRQAKTILLEMGHFFQVQDDYMDCFGDPEITGKIGTDIQDGKCSWLVVVALQRATPQQKKIIKECYGCSDLEKVQRIKHLYEELGLPATFATYEEESYNLIQTHIQQISAGLSHDLFFTLLEKIYRREN
ncbi:farnesyl pyrophosphate synthase [Nilaparvata lugens]|uniref:farnesyl pyrophosphate synthase n=1 Tax=Nilaparvata lugens TaxID=108931 RepID=UPI00193CDAD0|nr:farnesyl pyrophosphate synthase [Nilaparvata lugens]